MRRRIASDESGFTLPEVLVAMVMMLTVMFALYSIFDMSLRVFSFGNDKTEATENARLGLAKMEREIRAAYPYDKANPTSPDETLLDTWTEDEIIFGNDLNGDRTIECPGGGSAECETIGYEVYTPDESDTDALGRSNSPAMINQPVVEYVKDLSFTYYDESGNTLTPGSADESKVDAVGISLEVEVPGDPPRAQELSTRVSLRNRS